MSDLVRVLILAEVLFTMACYVRVLVRLTTWRRLLRRDVWWANVAATLGVLGSLAVYGAWDAPRIGTPQLSALQIPGQLTTILFLAAWLLAPDRRYVVGGGEE